MPVYVGDPRALKTKRERYETLRAAMWSERASFDAHYREIGDFILPRRTRFFTGDRNRGDKRNQNIIDSTARFSARTLSSGLHAGLTSPARPWMKLTTPDPALAEYEPVKEWLHQVTQRMLTIFLQANLYNALPVVYGDMGVFGTAAMSVLEDRRDLFRCYQFPIGSYAIGLDERGVATTFVREYELTVRQVVRAFCVKPGTTRELDWSKVSTTVKDLWDRGTYEAAVPLVWIVIPNDDANPDRLEAQYLPWSSCHYEKDGTASATGPAGFLRESGFRTFPILAPRWDVTSPEDCYGTDCPGMTALGDVKQLQIAQKTKGKGLVKQVDPPLVGPSMLRTQKTSLLPGDITYEDVREGMRGLRSIHEVNLNLGDLTADMAQTQYRIQRAFYEDLFLMLANSDSARGGSPITAREVEERHEEKLLALGPVLERTNDELLDPLVDRVYSMMEQAGLLPEAPDALDGVTLKVEYISILAQAQKQVGVSAIDRIVSSVGGLVQIWPEARHKINIFQVIDDYGDMLGVNPKIVRTTEAAQALVDAEQQQHQAAAAAEQTKTLAEAGQKAAATPMGGDTALASIMQAAGGGQQAAA